MSVDPSIAGIFGDVPPGTDLKQQLIVPYNIAVCVALGLAASSVALRFYVRSFKGAKLWYDDYAILASVIVYAEPYVYATAVTSTKVSILLLYRRLFHSKAGLGRLYSAMFWTATFLTTVYPFILWITMALACRPVSYYWTQYLGANGRCINVSLFFLLLGIVNMFNDIVILLVPVPRIWELQMNKRTKTSIIGIMLLGSFVCVASIVRIYYLNGLFQNTDVTWWMGPSFAWSSLEPCVAVISACLPTYAPLFRMGRTKSSQNSPYPQPGERSGGISGTGGARSNYKETSHHARSGGGGFGLSRSNAGHTKLEDDEFELECADTTLGHDAESKRS
ncbi:hypothetical protein CCHL11_02256 [Colletotrichum chlorophyti]|uniref:Rhodopsin domain-containing protein n=1 Tax=Colletotrichum chlorophyti TaxID=708187 RepID=A0A1Q8S6E4_9PEZI|nr:hypothetical protein CCHL11_02256 [Colletotrichum chlorophyti]